MKRIKTKILAYFLLASLIPCISIYAATEDMYDVQSALAYAEEHWNDETTGGSDQELCSGFVAHCLIKGNISFSPKTDVIGQRRGEKSRVAWDNSFNAYYYWGCWGLYHDLAAREYTEVYTLTQDITGEILWSQNIGRVATGDVIFFHLKGSSPHDNEQYEHVVIVGNNSRDKYVKAYAHNIPRNNEPIEIRPNREYICIHFTNAKPYDIEEPLFDDLAVESYLNKIDKNFFVSLLTTYFFSNSYVSRNYLFPLSLISHGKINAFFLIQPNIIHLFKAYLIHS